MPWERREGLDELPTTALRHCHYREDAWVQHGQCMSEVEAGQQISVLERGWLDTGSVVLQREGSWWLN